MHETAGTTARQLFTGRKSRKGLGCAAVRVKRRCREADRAHSLLYIQVLSCAASLGRAGGGGGGHAGIEEGKGQHGNSVLAIIIKLARDEKNGNPARSRLGGGWHTNNSG